MNGRERGLQSLAEAAAELKEKIAAKAPPSSGERRFKPPYSGPCREGCPTCSGLGWVRANADPFSEDFGHLVLCPESPHKNRFTNAKTGLSLNEEQALRWELIKPLSKARQVAAQVREIVERGFGLVYLWGAPGLAKTLILKTAVAESARQSNRAAYAFAADILDEIREAYGDDPRESAQVRLERWSSAYLLAIDEIDRVADTGWAREKMFQLLDRRHIAAIRRDSITLIASNKAPDELREPALADRFRDSRHQIIHVEGDSARPMMPKDFRY